MTDEKLGKALEGLRTVALGQITDILSHSKLTEVQRMAWETMQRNIASVGIGVLPGRKSLAEGFGYSIQGEHVVQSVVGRGKVEYISLPKEFIYDAAKGRLTLKGITTLFHEWAHNPLRFSGISNPAAREFMEEQLADALAMNLAMKMKFPPRAIYEHLVGRMPFIGAGAYRRYLRLAEEYAGMKLRGGPRVVRPRFTPEQIARIKARRHWEAYGLNLKPRHEPFSAFGRKPSRRQPGVPYARGR